MSLLRDIQAAAISSTTDLPQLLRMCKLLAARLGNRLFAAWVDHELDGYPDAASLPSYRKVLVNSYGSFRNIGWNVSKSQISMSVLPDTLRDHFAYAYMGLGVSAYVDLMDRVKQGNGSAREAWDIDVAVQYGSKAMVDMQCYAAWKEIPPNAISAMLDTVRNKVLTFAIEIERVSPDAGESPLDKPAISGDVVNQIFNTNIAGNVGNLSNAGSGLTQIASVDVPAGDFDAVRRMLVLHGVDEADIDALKLALDKNRAAGEPQPLGGAVGQWIGGLLTKAARGGVALAGTVVTDVVTKAILGYLGVS